MGAESPPGTSYIPQRTDSESVRRRVCGNQGARFALEAGSLASGSELRRFFLCPECGSLLDANVRGPAYGADADASGLSDETPHIKFYVEFGAGIEGFVAWIGLVRDVLGETPRTPRLLEVGAGFGFLAAVAQWLGFEAVGVEPSGIGRVGERVLGVPIVRGYDDPRRPLAAESFDVVVATEVIEHVADPKDFLSDLCRYLAPDGILLLTTPNAEVVLGGAATEQGWRESLSPGAHLTLLSPKASSICVASKASGMSGSASPEAPRGANK